MSVEEATTYTHVHPTYAHMSLNLLTQAGIMSVEEAAKAFTLPASLGAWTLFNPGFYTNAFKAWYRVLG